MTPMPALLLALLLGAAPLAAAAQAPDTLPVPHRFLEALDAGTRTRTGEPGPSYWQQRVDYRIDAELLPDRNSVRGSERIRYENRSPQTLEEVWLALPQNVYAPGNPRNRPVPVTGGFTLGRVVVDGVSVELEPLPGRASLGTAVPVPLPEPLPAGGALELEIDWSFQVPEGTFRMGREGSEVFYLAQWYPRVAVYDDIRGWAREPYLGDGEFYMEYGDFDVRITAPEGWLVRATGVLENPEEVLTPTARERLGEISREEVVAVVDEADRAAGRATADAPGGTLTWRWTAENVRDFAWGASDRYVWDATVAAYDDGEGGTRTSEIHVVYRPERPHWDGAAAYARHAVEAHSWWLPYPYPQMSVNEGVIGGGMEYPMITIIGGSRTPLSLYGVISHEIAHMWWPMVAGSDERRFAWVDEGLASFSEDLFTPELFPDAPDPGLRSMEGYLRIAGSDVETPSMRPADLYGPFGNRGLASYSKPATVFRMLREILTPAVFDEALRDYTRRWAYRHPHPLDLFWTFEDVTGRDLDWFFLPWLYGTGVLDQAVVAVEERAGRPVAVLEDRGEIAMPVVLRVATADGGEEEVRMGREAWEDGRMVVPLPVQGPVTEVVLDPRRAFPDVDREDNRWVPAG
jgi:hypothetical protein